MLATLRPARPLVRDARPRRRQRRDPRAAGPGATEGASCSATASPSRSRPPRSPSATCCSSARLEGPGRRGRRRGREPGRRVHGHRARACRSRRTRRRSSSARRSTRTARCAPARRAVGADTALAQIVKLVQEAQNSKAPGQRLADRAAFWLVLVALIGGPLTFAVWYFVVGRDVQEALLFAITVVVITCPDALGLATPTPIMVGTGLGAAARHPVQARDGAGAGGHRSTPSCSTRRARSPAASPRSSPSRPRRRRRGRGAAPRRRRRRRQRASARRGDRQGRGRERGLDTPARRRRFEAVPGHGAARHRRRPPPRRSATRACWSARASPGRRWPPQLDELAGEGRTSVQVAIDGQAAAVIAIADAPRETAAEAIARCKELGVRPVMLSGDSRATAERIAAELGIDEVIAEVLPGRQGGQGRRAPGRRAARSRWSATASTTRPRSRRPTSASPSAPAPTSPSRPPTSC